MSAAAWIEADWPAPPGVRALTTLRRGAGVSKPPFDDFNLGLRNGDDAEAVAANRHALIERLALPAAPHWLKQVHGTAVARIATDGRIALPGAANEAEADMLAAPHDGTREVDVDAPQADAAITSTPGSVLAILSADCLPLLLAARDGREIAAVHAGWRGLAAGVIESTVQAMATAPADLVAWLGPAAGPRAYEIGAEVYEAFVAGNPAAASAFVATRPGHWNVDLYALARQRLTVLGIAAADIHGGNRCTISEPAHFFSHRRDGRSGRIASLIWMAPRG